MAWDSYPTREEWEEANRRIALSNGETNDESSPKHFELIPFDAVRIDTTPAYLVKGIVPRTGLCIVWGPPKCGKSFLVFDMLMHVALGWQYRDRKVRQGAVVYCALEGCSAFKNRIEAFRQKRLQELAAAVPFYLMAAPLSLVADHTDLIAEIRGQCQKPSVVAIDTLNRSLAGSESSDEDMAAYIKAADAIRDAFNCAVVIVHHCGHEGTRPRGHSSLMGALDVQIAVTRDAAGKIIATVELMKDGPQGESWASKLDIVELGQDDDGDMISSCVVEAVEGIGARAAKAVQLPAGAIKALRALHEILDDVGIAAPPSAHAQSGQKVVTLEAWKEHAFKRGLCADEDRKLKWQSFKRAFDRLTVAGKVAVSGDFVWPIVSKA
jgi:hypothetical protein